MFIIADEASQAAKRNKRNQQVSMFLNAFKKEVMHEKWDSSSTGTPRGIMELRTLLNAPSYLNFITVTQKIHQFLDRKRSIFQPYLFIKEETQTFYDTAYKMADSVILMMDFYNNHMQYGNIYPNTHEGSNIEAVAIEARRIILYDFSLKSPGRQTSWELQPDKFFQLFNNQKDHRGNPGNKQYRIDDNIMNKIKEAYCYDLSVYPTLSKEKIGINDCLKIYTQIFELITKTKIHSNNPLTILIGEFHDMEHSLLGQLIVLFVSLQFGLKNVLTEYPHENNLITQERDAGDFFAYICREYQTKVSGIDSGQLRVAQYLQVTGLDFEKYTDSLKEIVVMESKNSSVELKENTQYQALVQVVRNFDIEFKKISDLRDEALGVNINHAVEGVGSFEKPDENIKMVVVGAGHLAGISKIIAEKKQHALLMIYFDASMINDKYQGREDLFPITSTSIKFIQHNPTVERINIPKNCEYYSNTEILNIAIELDRIFSDIQSQLLADDMAKVKELLTRHQEQKEWCSQLNTGIDEIHHAPLSFVLKRYRLNELVSFVNDAMKNAANASEVLKADLKNTTEQLAKSAFQISKLNDAERAQTKLLRFSATPPKQDDSAAYTALRVELFAKKRI